jgi:pimeloyl-ACP methyl ester carboxylesterase
MRIKLRRRWIKYTAIGLAALLVIYVGISIYAAFRVMEIPRIALVDSPEDVGLEYENVAFPSRGDAVTLKGWYLPGGGDKAILFVNGGYQNRTDDNGDTLGITAALVPRGYNILLFDQRGRGESEGTGHSLLNIEEDVGGAVDYLHGRGYGAGDVYIMGFCSGAAAACIFASQNEVSAMVLVGCFVDVPTMVVREAVDWGVPEPLMRGFLPGMFLMTRLIYGYEMVNPIDVIAAVECPILFIHEEYDVYIMRDEVKRLYEASTNPANEFWEADGTLHSQAFREHPAEFIEEIDGFLSAR